MDAAAVRVVLGLLVLLGATGCGRDVAVLDDIAGNKVSTMVERELEAQNPGLAPGRLTCPDLDFTIGAAVRCLRTTELSHGRVVKVRGLVEVMSIASGGRLHIEMDAHATEFGVSGDHLAADLRQRYLKRVHAQPSRLDCPYLRGAVGTTVTCQVEIGGKLKHVDVEVIAVDPESYRTTYVVGPHRTPSEGLPSLPEPTARGGLSA
jgi:hypothetical protein